MEHHLPQAPLPKVLAMNREIASNPFIPLISVKFTESNVQSIFIITFSKGLLLATPLHIEFHTLDCALISFYLANQDEVLTAPRASVLRSIESIYETVHNQMQSSVKQMNFHKKFFETVFLLIY